jgi:hypothetical protein
MRGKHMVHLFGMLGMPRVFEILSQFLRVLTNIFTHKTISNPRRFENTQKFQKPAVHKSLLLLFFRKEALNS